jgi:DNA-binding response OmpR family regulator
MTYKILIVDDDIELCNLLKQCLENEGYDIETIHTGYGAITALNQKTDLVILDVMLPEMSGFDVLKKIREVSNIPVLMLSAKSDEMDKVLGLRTGADDYLTKPFGLSELIARVDSLLRRFTILGGNNDRKTILDFGKLKIDTDKCTIFKKDTTLSLTAKEYKLICLLAQNPLHVYTKKQIYQNVWEDDFMYDDNTIMALIRRLRKKIEDDPDNPIYIQTVWGIGYRFNWKVN